VRCWKVSISRPNSTRPSVTAPLVSGSVSSGASADCSASFAVIILAGVSIVRGRRVQRRLHSLGRVDRPSKVLVSQPAALQADESGLSDRVAGTPSFGRKLAAARLVKELGWPLTLNVVH